MAVTLLQNDIELVDTSKRDLMSYQACSCLVVRLTRCTLTSRNVALLQETVDELRAEMALTRAAVQSYKIKLQQKNIST